MGKSETLNALSMVDQYLIDIKATKTAAHKKSATDPSEPTTQPVMKADDGTVKATTGSRAAENDSDIRKAYGNEGSTGQEDAHSASSTMPSDSIGTQKMDASETKGNVQTPKATLPKPTKNDGGGESPSHPTNSTFSEKYSKLLGRGKSFLEKVAALTPAAPAAAPATTPAPTTVKAAGEGMGENKDEKTNPAATQAPKVNGKEPEDAKKLAAAKYPEEAEAGYLAAALLAQQLGFSKEAAASDADPVTQARVEEAIKYAAMLADDYCDFLDTFEKRSGDEMGKEHSNLAPPFKSKKAKDELGKKANDLFPAGTAEASPMIPAETMAGDMGGGAGGPPMGGGGGGMDAGAGGMGAGGDDEAIIAQLAQALEEAGITPEQLAQAVAAEEGGGGAGGMGGGEMGGGGMPPGAEMAGGGGGGMPPGAPPATEVPAAGPEAGAEESSGGGGEAKEPREEKKEEKSEGKSEKSEESKKEASARKNQVITKLAMALRKQAAAR